MSEELTIAQLVQRGALSFGDGYRTKKSEHGQPGIPILRVAEVHNGYIRPEFVDYVSSSFRGAMGGKVSRAGDIVLTTKGTVGRVAIIPDDVPEFIYSPQVCYFRVGDDGPLTRGFLYYWFKGSEFWDQAGSRKSQTDMADYLNMADIRSLSLTLPSRSKQMAIVGVLGALDDKIAVNERIAVTADALANAHYRREQYDLIGEHEHLGKLARVVVGSTPSRAKPEYWSAGTVNWINSGKANEFRVIEPSEMITEEGLAGSSVKVMPPGATLIGITGATMGQVSRLEIAAGGSQNVAGVWSENPALNDWLFYDIRARASHLTKHASGGAQQHINKKIITDLVCVVPDTPRLAAWSATASPLLKYAAHALVENRALSTLRDTLLPQLMSGRLRVKDAEKIVEDHT